MAMNLEFTSEIHRHPGKEVFDQTVTNVTKYLATIF